MFPKAAGWRLVEARRNLLHQQHQKHPPELCQESQGHRKRLRPRQDSEPPSLGHPTGSLPWQQNGRPYPSKVHPRGPSVNHSLPKLLSNSSPHNCPKKLPTPSREKCLHKGNLPAQNSNEGSHPLLKKPQLEGQWVLWGFVGGGLTFGVPVVPSWLSPPSQKPFPPSLPPEGPVFLIACRRNHTTGPQHAPPRSTYAWHWKS